MRRRQFLAQTTAMVLSQQLLGHLGANESPILPAELKLLELALADNANGLLAPGAKLEKLWDKGEFTEGGAAGPDGCIYFSDIGNELMKFDPASGQTSEYRNPSGRSNGMIFDPRGRLVVAEGANTGGNRRVTATDLKTGKIEILADNYQGKKFNSPNDVAVDRAGRVYFTDPRYVGKEPRELDFEGVFRIDPEGTVARLNTGAARPNGIVVSPDGKTLYIAENSKKPVLLACPLDDKGDTQPGRVFYEYTDGRGTDGMTVTTDGRIVATAGRDEKSGVWVFSPEGKLLGIIRTPEKATNCEFGGPQGKTLYICAGVSLYRVETTMTGFKL